ncbi:MAG TPA: sigma-70 family RNA polymerase sigma factor, partial [Gemmata sp.]|nr:sigma-70 family RNA polymerase sigma factor [Gemmata sp.]
MMTRANRLIAATSQLMNSPGGDANDRVLLARFIQSRDEHAFAKLVERHGPLVLGTCRRLLPDSATADDVFQSTFIVLARQASRGDWHKSIGPWLYTVAVRLARKARSRRIVRPLDAASETELAMPPNDPTAPLVWDEVRSAIDEELCQLSETLSQPLILCYLQGLTRDEAANMLGISLAKIKRRLNSGRNLLRDRLSRRGITLAAAGWGLALASSPVSAEMREKLVGLAANSVRTGSLPPTLAELVASYPRHTVSRWLVLNAVVMAGVGIGAVAFAFQSVDQSPAQPPPARAADKPVPDKVQNEAPMDPLPAGAVARFGSRRLLDFTIGGPAALSPDGRLFATGGGSSWFCVWDAVTGKLVRKHQNNGSAFDLRWRTDGSLAAVSSFNFNVFLMQSFGDWKDPDFNDERIAAEQRAVQANPPENNMGQVLLSGNGEWAFAVFTTDKGKARRLDRFQFEPMKCSATVKPNKSIPIIFGPGLSGVWASHDGRTALVWANEQGNRRGRLAAYDLQAEKPDRPIWDKVLSVDSKDRPDEFLTIDNCLAIDGNRVVIMYGDGRVEYWDGPAGKLIRELPKMPKNLYAGHIDIRGIDLSADGKRVAMILRGPSNEVAGRVVEIETGKEVCVLSPQVLPRFGGVARFSADGKRVAQVASEAACIWNAETGADAVPLTGHRGRVMSLISTFDGKKVVSAGSDQTVREWDRQTGREQWRTTFELTPEVKFATPEGIVVQDSLYGDSRYGGSRVGSLLDARTGKRQPLPGALGEAKSKPVNGPPGYQTPDTLLAMSPDGKSMVTFALHDSAFRVWSWPGGASKKTVSITPPEGMSINKCFSAQFTPDGKQFIAAMFYQKKNYIAQPGSDLQRDPTFVERWDLADGKMLSRTKSGNDHSPPRLIPYPKGVLVLSDKPEIWDAVTGEIVVTLTLPV